MAADLDAIADSLAGRYTIERAIGSGGMATVYRAHDGRHDRPVALKVLRPEPSAVIGAERFLREIRTTANLQHPHILPLFDSGEAGGLLFYVMPFVAGESLRDRLARERALGVEESVRLASEVASALDYAHRQGDRPPGHQAGQHPAARRQRARCRLWDRAGGAQRRGPIGSRRRGSRSAPRIT